MLGRPLVLALAVLWLAASPARAAEAPADSALQATAPTASRDYVAEARAAFTPENQAYQRQRVALAIVSPLVGIAVGLLLLFTGVAQRLRDVANGRAHGRWARVLVFFTLPRKATGCGWWPPTPTGSPCGICRAPASCERASRCSCRRARSASSSGS